MRGSGYICFQYEGSYVSNALLFCGVYVYKEIIRCVCWNNLKSLLVVVTVAWAIQMIVELTRLFLCFF